MVISSLSANISTGDPIDAALFPLIELAETAVASRSRLRVLSLWRRLPSLSLFASHLHLRWPGEAKSLPLSPRIGIFPFFPSDLEALYRPFYGVKNAQSARQTARTKRFSQDQGQQGELYPDWEQAVDRRRHKLHHLTLPASSFISIDRINESGIVRQGNRPVIGRFAPRGEPRPQLLAPVRAVVTREIVRAFVNLDLVLVNIQNVRGKQLSASIEDFLRQVPSDVPMLIIASSPADLAFVGALDSSTDQPVVLNSEIAVPNVKMKAVNRDRAQAERQFCSAIDGLADKSEVMSRLVVQAKRTWWATRQSISLDCACEAQVFGTVYADTLERFPDSELGLLEEAKRLILEESENAGMRAERRNAIVEATLHDARPGPILIVVRSHAAMEELGQTLARSLGIEVHELAVLGIEIQNVFAPWPTIAFETCIACGYFGTSTLDLIVASNSRAGVMVLDPIEARVAIWDIEKRFLAVSELPEAIITDLKSICESLEAIATPSSSPISLPTLSGDLLRHGAQTTRPPQYAGKPTYVCLSFADGAMQLSSANARFEVVGRKRLQLQSVLAKDLHAGDQVVLLNEEERAGFSDRLLQAMDEGRLRKDKQTRSTWLTTLRAVRSANKISVQEIRQVMENRGIVVDGSTIRTWLPRASSEECGVPEGQGAFLAFARALDISIPDDILADWFAGINRLRINHRKIGRELVRAIRGAYLGRLDPVSVAKMEKEWGVEAKALLEAAHVAIVDDVIPLEGATHD